MSTWAWQHHSSCCSNCGPWPWTSSLGLTSEAPSLTCWSRFYILTDSVVSLHFKVWAALNSLSIALGSHVSTMFRRKVSFLTGSVVKEVAGLDPRLRDRFSVALNCPHCPTLWYGNTQTQMRTFWSYCSGLGIHMQSKKRYRCGWQSFSKSLQMLLMVIKYKLI